MAEIIELTQGHLEDYLEHYQDFVRQDAEAAKDEPPRSFDHPRFGNLTVKPPGHAALDLFWLAYAHSNPWMTPAQKQHGLFVRAAIRSGWIVTPLWTLEDVPRMQPAKIKWIAQQLDDLYEEHNQVVNRRTVQAASEAGWFTEPVPPIEELSQDEIDLLADVCNRAYRASQEIPPE